MMGKKQQGNSIDADLIMYRDGINTPSGKYYWLRDDLESGRELLESRILKATLVALLPYEAADKFTEHLELGEMPYEGIEKELPTSEALIGYLLNDLDVDDLNILERQFQKNPRALAKLLEIRDLIESPPIKPDPQKVKSFRSLVERVLVGTVLITSQDSKLLFQFFDDRSIGWPNILEMFTMNRGGIKPNFGYEKELAGQDQGITALVQPSNSSIVENSLSINPLSLVECRRMYELLEAAKKPEQPAKESSAKESVEETEQISRLERDIKAINKLIGQVYRLNNNFIPVREVLRLQSDEFDHNIDRLNEKLNELQLKIKTLRKDQRRFLKIQSAVELKEPVKEENLFFELLSDDLYEYDQPSVSVKLNDYNVLLSGEVISSAHVHFTTKITTTGDGNPIPDVKVTVVQPSQNFDIQTTDINGQAAFKLPIGRSLLIFQSDKIRQIEILTFI